MTFFHITPSLHVKVGRRFGYKYRGKSIGCALDLWDRPRSPSKLLLEIIDDACIIALRVSGLSDLSSPQLSLHCLSIANQMYFKATVYFKRRDGEKSIKGLSPYLTIIITFDTVIFFSRFYLNNEISIVILRHCPMIIFKMQFPRCYLMSFAFSRSIYR